MNSWDPAKYLKFEEERTRPAVDLVSRIAVEKPRSVIDLGCGPGNSTQVLRKKWPAAAVSGLDSSAKMIAAARQSYPEQEWILGRIEDWTASQPYDVVFSNAALQWTRNHAALTKHLFRQVTPGGALAIQIPSGAYSPVRTCIDETAADLAWASRMVEARCSLTMEPPEVYYDALTLEAKSVDLWETEYHHVLDSPADIVQWVSGTALRPFLSALSSGQERERFLSLLTESVTGAYPQRGDGRVLFPFKRTFVIAYA